MARLVMRSKENSGVRAETTGGREAKQSVKTAVALRRSPLCVY